MANPRHKKRLHQINKQPWEPIRPDVDSKRGEHEATIAGETFKVFKNNRYTILLRAYGKDMVHLSIRRNDREPIFDWRDVQKIKNELVGPENEGMQLFPAESRLVDTSNQFHLYVLRDPLIRIPVGYQERIVSNEGAVAGAVQRPFEPGEVPHDALSRETIAKYVEKHKEMNQ